MTKVILLSGLCADERLFCKLKLKTDNVICVNWIPATKDDTLGTYAEKLLPQLNLAPGEQCILVGVSFGGMIAVELAKRVPVQKTILISSLVEPKDLPLYYRIGGKLGLQKIAPLRLGGRIRVLSDFIFGAETPEEKRILHSILDSADIDYARWAMTQIVNWQQQGRPQNLVQIHGDHDNLLPICPHKDMITIKGAGHLLVLHNSDEVSRIINRHL